MSTRAVERGEERREPRTNDAARSTHLTVRRTRIGGDAVRTADDHISSNDLAEAGAVAQHPLDDMYAAREALNRAGRSCASADLAQLDWPPFGAALLGVLSSLHDLANELSTKLDDVDRDALYRDALRDHPHEALDRAVRDLEGVTAVLGTAMGHANKYWEEAQHIHEDTAAKDQE